MSHEIRTPFNAVLGLANLLLESSLDATQHDYVSTIRDSSNELLVVINDVSIDIPSNYADDAN